MFNGVMKMKKEKKSPQCIAVTFNGVRYPIKTTIENDLPKEIMQQIGQKLLKTRLKMDGISI
ncbi:MAG: hypothetical protein K0R18_1661 [Bacillales bacterium]|jgi:hypothetical protein|nr:hypothetical protein [Bacillales bacterium]